jgi:uncharacterized protein YqeY
MSLEILINNDIKSAMFEKNKEKLNALRAIKAALLLEKTGKDVSAGEIPESVELKVLQKLVKQRAEAAAIYREKGRPELADEEECQAKIIQAYLPEQIDEKEVEAVIRQIIDKVGATNMKDMGRVMGMATKQLAGKADNRIVSKIVRDLLNN